MYPTVPTMAPGSVSTLRVASSVWQPASAGGSARFLLEAPQAIRVGRQGRGQHFDRDVAIEPRVAGAVHLAHPAAPDEMRDRIRTEPRPACQRHRPPATSMNVPVEYDASSDSSQ